MTSNNLRCIWSGSALLGEGPFWHPLEKKLYWLDIAEPSINRLDIVDGTNQSWLMTDYVGTVVAQGFKCPSLRAKRGNLESYKMRSGLPRYDARELCVVATIGNQVRSIDLNTGQSTILAEVFPKHRRDLRMNDGKCDAKGRLWFGLASFDVSNPQGGLFCLHPDGRLQQMETGITIANGLDWSPDQKTFYFTDGLKYRIYQYDFDLDSGQISNRRIFLQLPASPVEPDGLTIDQAGCLWIAMWAGGQLCRYTPDAVLDHVLHLPVARPTSCAFGGDNYQTLFITSCSRNINEETKLPAPAGGIFAIDLAVGGFPPSMFGQRDDL